MRDFGKRSVLGVLVDAVDYEAAVDRILSAAHNRQSFGVSALAVHGVMTGVLNQGHRYRLNHLELVTPDGQPVRWALNLLYGVKLDNTVRGTDLTLGVLKRAADEKVPVYFYGSHERVLQQLLQRVQMQFSGLIVAGAEPSIFRSATTEEQDAIVRRITSSGAQLTFVGLGCPRQEVFVYELHDRLTMPALAVGAAFDYLAGQLREPPSLIRRVGLEWLWRLSLEPGRLWRRYILLNPTYCVLLALQLLHAWKPNSNSVPPARSGFLKA